MAQSLNALAVGALVKDTGTLYNGKPIIWKIADKGHTGYPSGAVTLITERIISLKCFDAIESGNSDGDRRNYGNNRWTLSNVRQWLNSQAAAGKWYSAQHSADAAPTNANVWSNYNEYDAEAGFLAGFSANFVAALLSTTHTVGKASVDGGGTESCTDKIFLATCTEVGLSGDVTAGSKLALFSDNNSRLAYPTAEAVSKSEYTNSSLNASSPWWWWLADAYASDSCLVRFAYSSGAMRWGSAYGGDNGVRPLCNLSSGILVSDSPDSDGAYTIIWNRAPSKPSSITVPSSVRGGESLSISWGASTDEDGNLSGSKIQLDHDRFLAYYYMIVENPGLAPRYLARLNQRAVSAFWKYRRKVAGHPYLSKDFARYIASKIFAPQPDMDYLNRAKAEFLACPKILRVK